MATPKSDGTAADVAIQRQLLTLVQAKGNGEKAFRLLAQGSSLVGNFSTENKATLLMHRAISCHHPTFSTGSKTKEACHKRSKESLKQWALVSAKFAQSVVKLYLGGAPASDDSDLLFALHAATLALGVVFEYESLARLGELVLENMLYQVAKKLSETAKGVTSSMWLFVALNVRIWHHHNASCAQLKGAKGEPSRAIARLFKSQSTPLKLEDMVILSTFPAPRELHTLQYSRLLISIANTLITVLLGEARDDDILALATSVEPWISHLSRIPGVDAKLPVSFSDRLFRVLWKCAAAVDAAAPTSASDQEIDRSLSFRSLALSFLLKCPSYTNTYFIQQVHRVGVQFEKKHTSTTPVHCTNSLRGFYLRSINALLAERPPTSQLFEQAAALEIDYIHWLEHFAIVSDATTGPGDHELEAAVAIYHGIDHTRSHQPAISSCWRLSAAAMVLDRRSSPASQAVLSERELRKAFGRDRFHASIATTDRETIVALLRQSPVWLESVRAILRELAAAIKADASHAASLSDALLHFILRSVRRAATRVFNAAVGGIPVASDVVDTIRTCLGYAVDLLVAIRQAPASRISSALEDSFLACEGRVLRLAVVLSARQAVAAAAPDHAAQWLHALDHNVRLFHQVIVTTADSRPSKAQLLVDLQAIARETYVCAGHFYRLQQHGSVALSLEAACALVKTYLSTIANDQEQAAHKSLKLDALAGLLAVSMRQIGELRKARQCHGAVILYASDPDLAAIDQGGAIDKYAIAVVEEAAGDGACTVVAQCQAIAQAWGSRGAVPTPVVELYRVFSQAFSRVATRMLDNQRQRAEQSQSQSLECDNKAATDAIAASVAIEQALRQLVWSSDCEQDREAKMAIVEALGQRTIAFGAYYASRDVRRAAADLEAVRSALSVAIDRGVLSSVDCGGCYAWRGVLALEICQLTGLARSSEATALDDIKTCLQRWRERDVASGGYFDRREAALCLDAVSKALSLLSHVELEHEARRLLSKLTAGSTVSVPTGLPSVLLHPGQAVAVPASASVASPSAEDSTVLRLLVVDAEIGLCVTAVSAGDAAQARTHLDEAAALMAALRSSVRVAPEDSQLYRALAMRELALCIAASDVAFGEGDLARAMREAKTALSICWKVSRRVAVAGSDRELPVQVRAALGKLADGHSTHTFDAIECWSWDVLLAAKLLLSRLATLHAYANRLHRSAAFHAEAMALVSAVVPAETRHRPYLEFAQLQLLAERTSHAAAVHQLITTSSSDVEAADVDTGVLTQHCEVLLQRGDLATLEAADGQAREAYQRVLALLALVPQTTPGVHTVSCGCHRRLARLHLRTAATSSSELAVDALVETLRQLKRAIPQCPNRVESLLATCQLVHASVFLLRSSRAFLPADQLRTLVDEAFASSDRLRIPYVTQEVRLAAGQVYLLLAGGDASLNWATAELLSSYDIVGTQASERDGASSPLESGARLARRVQEELPPHWLVASLAVGVDQDLTLSLTPTNGCEPQSFWIGNTQWESCTQELADIIAASRATLFDASAEAAHAFSSEQKKTWWLTRTSLDERLGLLVAKMQALLGFWRAVLAYAPSPTPSPPSKTLLDACARLLDRSVSRRSAWILEAVATYQAMLTDAEIRQCIDHVAGEDDKAAPVEAATVQQILALLRGFDGTATPSSSIILVLHRRLEQLPWEGLDVLLAQPSVTRMPSLALVLANARRITDRASGCYEIDASSVAYVLNPAGDLQSTERTLAPLFTRTLAWRGVVGSAPDEDAMRGFLTHADLFVYAGHGSGEKYFTRDKIAGLQGQRCAAALLFGCSSGRLEREGVFGPDGAVLAYLQAGSPAVLAMLWDVTDRDVDRVSEAILATWLVAGDGGATLSAALHRARGLCKLRHLNGLAAVCYGLPVRVAPREGGAVAAPVTKRRRLF